MEEKILEVLEANIKSQLTKEEIVELIGKEKGFDKAMNKLLKEGRVFETKTRKYALSSSFGYEVAIVSKAGPKGLSVETEEGKTYHVPTFASSNALYKDKVLISRDKFSTGIVKVIDQYNGVIVGEVNKGAHGLYIRPLEQSFPLIDIEHNKTKNAQVGHRVSVKITSRLPNLYGEIVEILGHKNDPKVDILSLAYQANVPHIFEEDVMKEVEDIESEVSEDELINLKDLTNELIVTVDGIEAKDLDDAISVKKNNDDTYTLGVHIADVSNYVYQYSAIDKEAFNRGTSVYLTDYVIPMLPHALSNGICSLNPDVIRLTISVEMKIDSKGDVIDYDIFESYIKSKHRLNYDDVNAYFNGNHEYPEDLSIMLNNALELSKILQKNKEDRGALDLDVGEAKIIVDNKGKPIDVVLRKQDKAEKLIEDFMIAANETVATHIYWQSLPFVYRVHDKPRQARFNEFCKLIEPLGYKIRGERNGVHPLELQSLLNRIKDQGIHDIVSTLLLRSMSKAIYSPENIGHFGLASKCYTHFTSPIRRYPDLMVHRLLKMYTSLKPKKLDELYDDLVYQCEVASHCERRAIELERQVDDMKKAEFMEDKVGEKFDGKISGMISSGIFVELPNTIEGMVRFEDMEDDFYTFDEKRMIVIGEGSKKILKLGDKVVVKLKQASKESRRIDFYLVNRRKNGSRN